MNATPMKLQRGQAMSEFVAAMIFLFVPLFMGIFYIGKYADIKHQAIQASRYAAMESALDPQVLEPSPLEPNGHESVGVIQNETVARFFRDGGQHAIGLDDQAQGATATDENPVWSQVNGDPMLDKYSDVSVQIGTKSIDSVILAPTDLATKAFNGLHNGYGVEADVEVPVVNIPQFAALTNIKIAATTVIAADPWNGDGAKDVGRHFTDLSVPGRLASVINTLTSLPGISELFKVLAGTPAPVFGCVKPDVVPTNTAQGAKYNSSDNPTNPSNPNDQCY
jgi:hypothetical protein